MVSVGIIDSGGPVSELEGAAAFDAAGEHTCVLPDRLGHGTAISETIRRACPSVSIIHAQVFDTRPVTSALRIVAALHWFAEMPEEKRVDIICMSLGLKEDRAFLREVVGCVQRAGILLVASCPARGPPSFPAAYPGVIAATGDARCDWTEISHLHGRLFGAWSNSPEKGGHGMAGSSMGAARVAGYLAELIDTEGALTGSLQAITELAQRATYRHNERRQRL